MNELAQIAPPGLGSFLGVQSNGMTIKPLTRMSLVHTEQRIHIRLRFGNAVRRCRIDRSRSRAFFEPAAVFCRVRYDSNERGRTLSQLMGLQAGAPFDAMDRVLGIAPGTHLLLRAQGTRQVHVLLDQMSTIEALGIGLAAVSPAYWRTLHNRLAAQMSWPAYTVDRHVAQPAGGRLG
jgi:hypothetical protein